MENAQKKNSLKEFLFELKFKFLGFEFQIRFSGKR